jgi:hypothetical protein
MVTKELFEKFALRLREDGVFSAAEKALSWVVSKIKKSIGLGDQIQARRLHLSRQLDKALGSTVKYGPFKGLSLSGLSWWGSTDRAGMLLGIYEQEILSTLESIPPQYRKSFIDLGAADGYYAIGVLINNLFETSYCFEISEKGQQTIEANAALNGVERRVHVFGIAEWDFYSKVPDSALSNSVLLVDIEGAEFGVLSAETFKRFSNSIIIIELHDHFFPDGQRRLAKLRGAIGDAFHIEELTTTKRDLSVFPELREYSDTDRWLICSEGRRALPHWYVLRPAHIQER